MDLARLRALLVELEGCDLAGVEEIVLYRRVWCKGLREALPALLDVAEAAEQAKRWLATGTPEDDFEPIAEWFYEETGYLRPGKDSVEHSHEQRERAWEKWRDGKQKSVRANLAAALAASGEATP